MKPTYRWLKKVKRKVEKAQATLISLIDNKEII